MDWAIWWDHASAGVTGEMMLRLAFATVAGTLIGIERERHGRAAGLRTLLLVCISSCIAMIVSDGFYRDSFRALGDGPGWRPDPARLAAGVLAGMGFLGAGVIIRQSNQMIRGVTTAASLWLVSIIGLAFGAGAVGIGVIATALSLAVLVLFPYLEARIKNDWYSDLGVTFAPSLCSVTLLVEALEALQVKVKGIDLQHDLAADSCRVVLHLRYKRKGMVKFAESITAAMRGVPGVSRIEFQS